MNTPENNFFKKLGQKAKKVALGVGATALLVHSISQENPSTLSKETSPISIKNIYSKFDTETRRELEHLESAYIQIYTNKYPGADEKVISQRFKSLIATYGEGLRISFTNDETKDETLINMLHQKTLGMGGNRPHYNNATVFYRNQEDEYGNDHKLQISYNFYSFVKEFSHHINQDAVFGRMVRYGKDLIKTGGSQKATYEDTESVEYQAHSVTEPALLTYLFASPHDRDVSFEEIRSHAFHVYEKIQGVDGLSNNERDVALFEYFSKLPTCLGAFEGYEDAFFATLQDTMVFAAERSTDEQSRYVLFARRFHNSWSQGID